MPRQKSFKMNVHGLFKILSKILQKTIQKAKHVQQDTSKNQKSHISFQNLVQNNRMLHAHQKVQDFSANMSKLCKKIQNTKACSKILQKITSKMTYVWSILHFLVGHKGFKFYTSHLEIRL